MSYLTRVERELAAIREGGRYRELDGEEPRYVADFSSNDYLALAADSRMVEAMRHVKRVGSGGARLLGGRHREHWLLEQDIARWLGRERALIFSSGYMAALGAIPALAPLFARIRSDELNHACLIDGMRLSRTPREIYAHGSFARSGVREAQLVVSESLFGMDGDVVDVRALLARMSADDVLLLDEAHALGVYGSEGAGVAHGIEDERILVLGTLSKAVGSAGGFIAGPERTIELLINTARTFIFDTAPPPAIAFAARVGIMLLRSSEDRRARLREKVSRLRTGLRELGIAAPGDEHAPIVPVVLGEEDRAMNVMAHCRARGINAPAVRPPTVPPGSSRLRISIRADHTDEQIDLLLSALECSGIS